MNYQGQHLSTGAAGEHVALLHRALAQLGYPIDPAERSEQRFGPTTHQAVADFQAKNNLAPTGLVDEVTARAIAAAVMPGGLSTQPPAAPPAPDPAAAVANPFIVQGVVTSPSGRPLAGLVVRAADVDLRSEQALGEAVTDEKGHYEIRYGARQFSQAEKGSADLAVRVFNAQGQLLYEPGLDGVLFNAPLVAEVDIRLETGDAPRPSEYERILADVTPLLGDVPAAGLREDEQVHDATFLSRETGWSVDRLEHLGMAFRLKNLSEIRPDFFYALMREDTLLKFDLQAAWQTNFEINLRSDAQTVYYEMALLDPPVIRSAVQAAITQAVVPAAVMDALDSILKQLADCGPEAQDYLRKELPRRILNVIGSALESGRAAEAVKLIEQDGDQDLGGLINRLQQAALLINPAGAPSIQASLDLAALLAYDQDLVDGIRQAQGIEDPGQVRKLAGMSPADWKDALSRSTGQLRAGGEPVSPELIDLHAAALARKMEQRFPTAAFAAQLRRDDTSPVPERAALLSWLDQHPDFDLLSTNIEAFFRQAAPAAAGQPSGAAGAPPAAESSPADTESYPTVTAGDPGLASSDASATAVFFPPAKGGAPDAGANDAAGNGAAGAPPEALKRALKRVQRVFRLAPNYPQASALLRSGIGSAHDIYALGQDNFTRAVTENGAFTPQEAQAVFHKAGDVHLASTLLAAELRSAVAASTVPSLSGGLTSEKLTQVTKDFPNLASLFTQTDLCQCDECRSIAGPAAYLVDALQFLKNRLVIDTTGGSPVTLKQARDVLFERRPDLGDLDLSCDNTNTPLPYIDLVCEVLEEAAAPDPGISYSGPAAAGAVPPALASLLAASGIRLTDAAALYPQDAQNNWILRDAGLMIKVIPDGAGGFTLKRTRQTFLSSAELLAAPEYVNDAAYAALAASQVAFHLPFDLFHQESRRYFEQFGIRRADLMRALQTSGAPADFEIAADALGLTDAERALITTPDPANQDTYWVPGPNPTVDTWLTRSELTYAQLQDLLALHFIDPTGSLFIKHLDSSCDTTQQVISGLDADALDRMHRFLRFWRKSGWHMAALDAAINAPRLGNGALDNAFIVSADILAQLHDALGLPVETLAIFYGRISTDGSPSPYAQIFLNKSANGVVDDTFLPEAVLANETSATPLKLVDVRPTLALSLGVQPADLDRLIDLLGALAGISPAADAILSMDHLAMLYALAVLSRALGLKISEVSDLQAMTGINPLHSPADTLTFVQKARKLRAAGLKAADLKFFLRQQADDLPARMMKEAAITALLTRLQSAYQDAFAASRSPFNPALSADENQGAVKDLLARLANFSEADANKFMTILAPAWADPNQTADAFINEMLGGILDAPTLNQLKSLQDALAAASQPAQVESARQDLIQALLGALSAYFFQTAQQDALLQTMMAAFKTGDELTRVLLGSARLKASPNAGQNKTLLDLLTNGIPLDTAYIPPAQPNPPAISAAAFPDLYGAVRLFAKIAGFIKPLNLSTNTLAWLLLNSRALSWLELDAAPYDAVTAAAPLAFADWETFQDGLNLMQAYPPVSNPDDAAHPLALSSLLDAVLAGSPAAEVLDRLTRLAGWDPAVLSDLDAYFGFSTPDLSAYQRPATYQSLAQAVALLRTLGLDLPTAQSLITPTLTAANAQTLRAALKARYADSDWLGVLKGIQDGLRDQKRDALVAYLLAQNPDFTSSDDLFDYFLVDVELDACQPTSRIVQAHGTLQLFVQRCLMGLEPRAVADVSADHAWDQWQWMANYRVWQANREIFLYPENWIAPELRDDKSFLFKDLETELLQNELNELNTESATVHYLETLDEIARLEVAAVYYQTDTFTMHVFARSKGGDPAAYYYRRFEKERYWTPWEKVGLDIASDHLLAFARNDRLYLAWPVFSEDANQNQDMTIPNSSQNGTTPVSKALKRWKVQLAISEYTGSQWLPKKVSKDALYSPRWYEILPAKEDFRFTLLDLGQNGFFVITTYLENGKLPGWPWVPDNKVQTNMGAFLLTGCKSYPEVPPYAVGLPNVTYVPVFRDTAMKNLRFKEMDQDKTDDLSETTLFFLSNFLTLVNNTPGTFYVTYPQQMSLIDQLLVLLEILVYARNQSLLYSSLRERRLVVPLGTLMPYFYDDRDRNYVIIPGFYSSPIILERGNGGSGGDGVIMKANGAADADKTFSDVLPLVEEFVALLITYWKIWQANPGTTLQQLIAKLTQDPEYIHLLEEWKQIHSLQSGVRFKNFYHPLVCSLRTAVNRDGLSGLMTRDVQMQQTSFDFTAANMYNPTQVVIPPYPVEDIDFSEGGSYASYNWELFFHLPFRVAMLLSQNQQFEAARAWFHYIFNPTGALPGDPLTPQSKYWVTKPFYQYQNGDYLSQRIDNLLYQVAQDPSGSTITDLAFAVAEWRDKPFKPDVVARSRPVAYQKAIVINYIKNLIAWGDNLFQQDTMESVNQATQMYVLADKLLGPKPRVIPPLVEPPPDTYWQLEAKVDLFGNALLDLENLIPNLNALPEHGAELPSPLTYSSLYFCIPQNDNLLKLWDTVADRLYKIRHCQNFEGVERILALFSPPIDPGALVRAAAAGLDISAIIGGLNTPRPFYRFSVMVQKAAELAQEVRALGGALQLALEKRDGEALALLRNTQEQRVLEAMKVIKEQQVQEAAETINGLNLGRLITQERKNFYQSQVYMNVAEALATALSIDSLGMDAAIALSYLLASGEKMAVPEFAAGGAGFGGSPVFVTITGGQSIGDATADLSRNLGAIAAAFDKAAALASQQGAYQRRQDDWDLQVRLADRELAQMDSQISAATIRQGIAAQDLNTQQLQIDNAKALDTFMRGKFTNQDLFEWSIGQTSTVYFQAYNLALQAARKAERCFNHELATSASFIQPGYWDNLKKGLQAADQLIFDLKRMESAYLDQNRREYELMKSVSLAALDPLALLQLKNTGKCSISLPEVIFDMDNPGQYLRRLKAVSLTIPCVTGPYTTVSCKLSLVSSKYRSDASLNPSGGTDLEKYAEVTGSDPRFVYNVGSSQSIVTSTAQNDSGLFELNFHDERYLPFEGAGAISTWQLELPDAFRQFDYDTITDVILHLRYTARDGGASFKSLVEGLLRDLMNALVVEPGQTGLFRLINIQHEYPNAWNSLLNGSSASLTVTQQQLPFSVQDHAPSVSGVVWVVQLKTQANQLTFVLNQDSSPITFHQSQQAPNVWTGSSTLDLDTPITLTADAVGEVEELYLLINYALNS